ncbi:MAG: ABC transporter ATP-binding protein [Oscillospiraceae bacterium]|nr:ABC transporter ATP-binding protein [Oscillospiraceae bacterium]
MSIKAIDICKHYNVGGTLVRALDGVSLDILKGEYVTITGVSGSGKSTLMSILGCLDTPTSGTYLLDGSDVSCLTDRQLSGIRSRKIGFVFQSFNLVPSLTAAENVELPLIYRGVPKNERRQRAKEALEIVGLSDRAKHRPSEMSGGQQQRTAIARAIASDPCMILADEPCGNLDSRNSSEVMEILSELNRHGKTIVMITHDEQAAKKAQRLIRIADGRIVT